MRLVALLFLTTTYSFSIQPPKPSNHHLSTTRLLAKPRKASAAEKRKRRAKRLSGGGRGDTTTLPPSKLNFRPQDEPDPKASSTTSTNAGDHEIKSKAQALLDSQRESVAMLTLMRERIVEKLASLDLKTVIEQEGFVVIDDFLGDETRLTELSQEATTLLASEKMNVDVERLGMGEYIASLEGGPEQYTYCPRAIEFVVAMTKHFPSDSYDKTSCQATMRTFDRKAHLASQALLLGEDYVFDEQSAPEDRPFTTVVTDENDKRRLSLCYYIVPKGWSDGGNMSFQDNATVEAKRDRLVLWKSDRLYRMEPWFGNEHMEVASCLELHLLG